MSRILSIAALLVLLAGIVFASYLGVAEAEFRRGTPESVAHAVEMRPDNARYVLFRALQLDYEGQDAQPLLERAAALNPSSSAPRIRLGLMAELRHDPVTAEHWLLSAARVDRQYEPSWTLANFYFRQQRADDFWTWIRRALEVSYGDRTRAFELCWNMMSNSTEILDRAIPEDPMVATAYLAYLLNRHRDLSETGAIEEAALRLGPLAATVEPGTAYAACDFLIERGRVESARKLWGALGNGSSNGITKPNFREMSKFAQGHGFDWRLEGGEGVIHVPLDGRGHRVTLTGKQPENTGLLRQAVVLEQGKRYTLRWKARTTGLTKPSGLNWNAGNASEAVEPSNDWSAGSLTFTAGATLVPMVLTYRRPQGVPRAEGSVDVTELSLTLADAATSSAK